MLRTHLQDGIAHVGLALREPEAFTLRWHRGEARYAWWVWGAMTAIAGTTFLVALVTTSWGGLAMIASIPINWFFTVSFQEVASAAWVPRLVLLVNLVVFAGVGMAMIDVFGRVIESVEPRRGARNWWRRSPPPSKGSPRSPGKRPKPPEGLYKCKLTD